MLTDFGVNLSIDKTCYMVIWISLHVYMYLFELIKVIGVTVTSAPQIYVPLEMHFVNDDFHGCNPLVV